MTCVVFLHIGRTGGTTLGRILERQYSARATYFVDDTDLEASLTALASMPEAERRRLRVVRGHVAFGLHERLGVPVRYLTLLRDPVSRVLSHFHYVRSRPYHRFHDEVVRRKMTLMDYLDSGLSLEVDNWQTRVLAGDVETPAGECGAETLRLAQRNVEEWFQTVGLLERFDEALLVWRRRLGWRLPLYVSRNAARVRHASPVRADAAAVAAVADRNRLDLELYRWASQRLDEAVSAEPGLARELARFRRLNRVYAPLRRSEVWMTELARDLVRGR